LTFFVGFIGIPLNGVDLDILSKWLTPSINLLHPNSNHFTDWSEFAKDAVFSVSLSYLGIILAFFLYKPPYSPFSNFDLVNSLIKTNLKKLFSDKLKNGIYAWSNNRGYIDAFYARYLTGTMRRVSEFTHFFDRQVVDGITNGVGLLSFFVGETIKSIGGGRISSYLFLYSSYVSIFLLIASFFFRKSNFRYSILESKHRRIE
jgi:NAD(P)H-quinone oxidoreductase subunit 5